MEDQAVSQSSATYEDAVAELVMLSQQLPVGSYWKDDRYMYKINLIKLSGIALAECTRITIVRPDDVEYSYHINNKILLFVSNIPTLMKSDYDEYADAEQAVRNIYIAKNTEMFQKQCLLKTPTDVPFTSFEVLHDEIIELRGNQHFLYEPTVNCIRVMRINMDTYNGSDTLHDEWHFFLEYKDDNIHVLSISPTYNTSPMKRTQNTFGEIVNRHNIFPITEYQFTELVKFIENNPTKNA